MGDDDQQQSDDSSSGEAEPPPEGDNTEPAPAGESSSGDDSDKPLEDNEGHSDSSAETDGDSDNSDSSKQSDSSSDDSSSSSNSSDNNSGQNQSVQLSEDDIQEALTSAFQARDVHVDDEGVKVSTDSGLYTLMVRLTADSQPLPQIPDDASGLAPGSMQGAMKLIQGTVQVGDGACRVIMKVTSVETSQILEVGKGDASGSTKDAVQAAAEDALAGLTSLGAT
jgi:hypothetical protein